MHEMPWPQRNGGGPLNGDGVIWITGAGKGIGRALALNYAAAGRTVAISARTEADLMQVQADAKDFAGTIYTFPLDTTDATRVAKVVASIEADAGPIVQAVLNAGTHKPTPVDGFAASDVSALFDVNVMGTVNCLVALLKPMAARKGSRIAVVASLAGYRGLPTASAYGATKAALINMCEALRPELESKGIVLQLVNPGFVETPLTDKNDFPMPFMISAEDAATRIVKGLQKDRFQIAFPTRFALLMKTLRLLPEALYFRITRKMLT